MAILNSWWPPTTSKTQEQLGHAKIQTQFIYFFYFTKFHRISDDSQWHHQCSSKEANSFIFSKQNRSSNMFGSTKPTTKNIQPIAKKYCVLIELEDMSPYAEPCLVTHYYSNGNDLFQEALLTYLQIINPLVISIKDHHLTCRTIP